jgi:hypothetical protein
MPEDNIPMATLTEDAQDKPAKTDQQLELSLTSIACYGLNYKSSGNS